MPTLIRLLVILIVLAALAYGAMFALIMSVEPKEKEVTIRIPTRDLMDTPQRDPLVLREIDTSRTADSPPPEEPSAAADPQADGADAVEEAPADAAPAPEAEDGSIVTLSPGVE